MKRIYLNEIDYGAGDSYFGYISPKLSPEEVVEAKENRRQKWAYQDYVTGKKKKSFWKIW